MRHFRWISCGLIVTLILTLSPVRAAPKGRMELVSHLGRKAVVKIYSGESLTFHVREVRGGLTGIFNSGGFLRGVSFSLRAWPRIRQDAMATAKGGNRSVVREKRAEPDLWGLPASHFTVEDEPAPVLGDTPRKLFRYFLVMLLILLFVESLLAWRFGYN